MSIKVSLAGLAIWPLENPSEWQKLVKSDQGGLSIFFSNDEEYLRREKFAEIVPECIGRHHWFYKRLPGRIEEVIPTGCSGPGYVGHRSPGGSWLSEYDRLELPQGFGSEGIENHETREVTRDWSMAGRIRNEEASGQLEALRGDGHCLIWVLSPECM